MHLMAKKAAVTVYEAAVFDGDRNISANPQMKTFSRTTF